MTLIKFIVSLIFLLNVSSAVAADTPAMINVDLFLSSTCPHCHKADTYFRDLEKSKPWLQVHRYFINQDKAALQSFYEHLHQQQSINFSVPAIFFCGSYWTGFKDEVTTGKALLHALNYCHKKISQQGELKPTTVQVLQKWGVASQFQITAKASRSLFNILISSALTDAFSPCSLFCFAAFLAFLWLFPAQKMRQLGVGLVFLASLAVIHYIQQTHITFYYQLSAKLHALTILMGVLLLCILLKKVFPFVLLVVIGTVCAMQISQQSCLFNMSLVFEQWLGSQTLSTGSFFVYQALYQVIYILPLLCLLIFFLIFSQHKRMRYVQLIFNFAAYLILWCIGLILIIHPQWLANLTLSICVFIAAMLIGWIRVRREVSDE